MVLLHGWGKDSESYCGGFKILDFGVGSTPPTKQQGQINRLLRTETTREGVGG